MNPTDSKTPLKVTLVSHSDMLGGASIVTYRLMNALRHEGIDARMLVFTKVGKSDNIESIGSRGVRGFKFMLERLRIFLGNNFNREDLFKVSIANIGMDICSHPWIVESDVVCVNWINQGMMSLKELSKLTAMGKAVVWTMHDMWCMTGICHHAYECDGYLRECGHCPFLHSGSSNDLSHKVWKQKNRIYSDKKITFVAVSNWLARKAAESSLLKDQRVVVIPNAFPTEAFLTTPTHTVETFNINLDRNLIVMGAARLDDPIKGLDLAVDALNYIFDNYPDIANTSTLILFGDLRNRQKLDLLRFPYQHIGKINDWRMLRQLYASAKVVLSTSLYETLPGTLIEGQAAGCLPVSFGRGGQSDIITEHKVNGYIARYRDIKDIAEGILWGLNEPRDREALHVSVGKRFSAENVAKQYIALFNELLGRNEENQ